MMMIEIDPYWIIVFVFIHLYAFIVEKAVESSHQTIFTGGNQFGKMGFETFEECFEPSNEIFWGVKCFHFSTTPFHVIFLMK